MRRREVQPQDHDMPEAIRAAIARQRSVNPKDARHFAGMTQHKWADWWGISTSTVSRIEEAGSFERMPQSAHMMIALWLALFGPEPEEAFRAVGRWALGPDIRNATDALFVRAEAGPDPVEAMTAEVMRRARLEAG